MVSCFGDEIGTDNDGGVWSDEGWGTVLVEADTLAFGRSTIARSCCGGSVGIKTSSVHIGAVVVGSSAVGRDVGFVDRSGGG